MPHYRTPYAHAGAPGARALSRVRVVLMRTRNPQNLGAAARALRCAGITRWTLVDPLCDPDDPDATRLAVRAEGLLQLARVESSLADAVRGCDLTLAATARPRADRPGIAPREAARRMVACPGETAIVFGDEQDGLHGDEVAQLDQITTMHSSPEQPSWNLAQAVAIYSHELRGAAIEAEERPSEEREANPARMAAVSRALGSALVALDRPRTQRRLFPTLERARMSSREASVWIAVLERIRRAFEGRIPPVSGPPADFEE